MKDNLTTDIFATVTGDDTPEFKHEPANLLRHSLSLMMTKLADGLIDPKLVLTWLLTALGVPHAITGLLVPVREAGALLPQLFTAGWIKSMERRKWAWVLGSAVQGLAAAAIVLAALVFSGILAGVVIVALLGVLAVARSVCSVSYKDILGKTVAKTHRGTTTGLASSVSAAGVIVFAALLMFAPVDRIWLVLPAIAIAAALWLIAAWVFAGLREDASQNTDTVPLGDRFTQYIDLLRKDGDLRRFIATRGLLTASSLAPPYLVILSGSDGESNLGALVLASALASLVSSYVWGRFADRSSRWVLIASGGISGLALASAVALNAAGVSNGWAIPGVLFVLMIAYHGVRQGRSTYLVDMAPEDRRSDYAALANTIIGTLLLVVGAAGSLSALIGVTTTLLVFCGLCLAGAVVGLSLREVEGD